MALFNLGIAKIELASLTAEGGAGTAFSALGFTQEGTAKLEFADPEVQELKVEEKDTAVDVVVSEGEKTISFTVANPDEDTLVAMFGGAKTGTGTSTVYKAPATTVVVEKTLKITPRKGLGFIFTKCSITAKFTSDIGKANWLGLEITAKVLSPNLPADAPWSTFRV